MAAQLKVFCSNFPPSPMSNYKKSHDKIPQALAVRRPASFRFVAGAGHVVFTGADEIRLRHL